MKKTTYLFLFAACMSSALSCAGGGGGGGGGSGDAPPLFSTKEFEDEVLFLRDMAEKGDLNCQYLLGFLLSERKWTVKASRGGHPKAQAQLGKLILEGKYRPDGKSEEELSVITIDLLEKAAGAGDAKAQYQLALELLKGEHSKKNEELAFSYMMQSAQQGYEEAFCEISLMFKNGSGCEKSIDASEEWLAKYIEAGNKKAFCDYVAPEEVDIEGIPNGRCRRSKIIEILENKAEEGNLSCQYLLGTFPDKEKWMLIASERGHLRAKVECSKLIFDGNQSISLLKEAAYAGDAEAQYLFALELLIGENCDINEELAFSYMMKSAQQGYQEAFFEVGRMLNDGSGCKEDIVASKDWFVRHIEAVGMKDLDKLLSPGKMNPLYYCFPSITESPLSWTLYDI